MRIQANTDALAAYGLTLADLRTAIASANANGAKGTFDGPTRAYTINANDQLPTAADYANQIIAYKNGAPVRLKDVAKVVDGPRTPAGRLGRRPANAGAPSQARHRPEHSAPARRQCHRARSTRSRPPARSGQPPAAGRSTSQVLTDRTTGIRASVHDVEFELMLAVALVVPVIFLFLRSVQATFIASVAVPLSLVGTFAVMYLLDFTLNNLTLMALTIADRLRGRRRHRHDREHRPLHRGRARSRCRRR